MLVCYWPSLQGDFVRLDDYQYVVDNELVRQPSWAGVERFFAEVTKPSTVEGYYQPLTMLSLMADVLAAGGDLHPGPFVFHLTNILLHAATAVLVVLVVRRMVGGLAVPVLMGVLFALHPAQVESVSWISQRKTLLASLFAVACIACYLRYGELRIGRRSESPDDPGQPAACVGTLPRGFATGWLLAAITLYLLAGLAKPTVMLLPLVLPLLDFWPLKRPVLRSLLEKLPFLIIMAPMCWVAWVSQASAATLQRPTFAAEGAMLRWVGLLCYNLMLYAGNVVWPFSLSPYRALPADLNLTNPPVALAVVGTIGLLAVWITSARWSRPLFVGLTAFGIVLLPALGPVRFMGSCVADRFTYLPMVFLLFPLAVLARRLESLLRDKRWLVWVGLGLLAAPLVMVTQAQQGVWRDSKTLWTHIADAVPEFAKAQTNLAFFCFEEGEIAAKAGKVAAAEEQFAAAEEHARRVLRQDPENPECLHVLGCVCTRTGRAAEAVSVIEKALHNGLGKVEPTGFLTLAEAYLLAGDAEAARRACQKALAAGRTPADTYFNMGDTAMRIAKRFDLAAEYFRLAVEQEPDNAVYHWSLGTALNAGGFQAKALEEYERALAILASQGSRMPELEAAAANLRRQIGRPATAPSGR